MRNLTVSTGLALACAAVLFFDGNATFAANLLANPGLENGGGPQNWNITQSITGSPTLPISAVELVDSADIGFQPPPGVNGLGLLVKSFAGNQGTYLGQNKAINVSMSQTVAAPGSKTFNFSGNSFFQVAASNNLTTLFPDSPSGAIASPAQTTFTVDFLDAGGNVLATNSVNPPRNRPTDANPADWVNTAMNGIASPAATTQARVTVSATNMVASCDEVGGTCTGGHDVYFDNFALVQQGAFGGDLLATKNGNLNTVGAPNGWSLVKTSNDNFQLGNDAGFCCNNVNNPSSTTAMWLRAYNGGDAKIVSDPVAATAGGQYTFSAYSKWETGYGAANPFPPSGQTRTSTFMKIDFLDTNKALLSSQTFDLCQDPGSSGCTVQQNDAMWRQFSMMATAPAGTKFVQVEAGAANMYNTGVNPQSAFFDDFSLTSNVAAGVPGDYNGDGVVNAADYVTWKNGGPLQNEVASTGVVDVADYTAWKARFGNHAGSGSALGASAVPEPTSICMIAIVSAIGLVARRREN